MPLTPAQLARLPRYARREINRLALDLAAAQNELRQCETPGETDTRIVRYNAGNVQLPRGSRIRFGPDDTEKRIDVHYDGERVVVMAGASEILVWPRAANVIWIEPATR